MRKRWCEVGMEMLSKDECLEKSADSKKYGHKCSWWPLCHGGR